MNVSMVNVVTSIKTANPTDNRIGCPAIQVNLTSLCRLFVA